MLNVTPCIGCGGSEARDCPLYLCEDEQGFVLACCIVYAYAHNLTITGDVEDLYNGLTFDDDGMY